MNEESQDGWPNEESQAPKEGSGGVWVWLVMMYQLEGMLWEWNLVAVGRFWQAEELKQVEETEAQQKRKRGESESTSGVEWAQELCDTRVPWVWLCWCE